MNPNASTQFPDRALQPQMRPLPNDTGKYCAYMQEEKISKADHTATYVHADGVLVHAFMTRSPSLASHALQYLIRSFLIRQRIIICRAGVWIGTPAPGRTQAIQCCEGEPQQGPPVAGPEEDERCDALAFIRGESEIASDVIFLNF